MKRKIKIPKTKNNNNRRSLNIGVCITHCVDHELYSTR